MHPQLSWEPDPKNGGDHPEGKDVMGEVRVEKDNVLNGLQLKSLTFFNCRKHKAEETCCSGPTQNLSRGL